MIDRSEVAIKLLMLADKTDGPATTVHHQRLMVAMAQVQATLALVDAIKGLRP